MKLIVRISISTLSQMCLSMSFLLVLGCSEMVLEDYGGAEVSDPMTLHTGDLIRVVSKDIEDFRFVLNDITGDSLVGSDIEIKFSDIRSVEVITPRYLNNRRREREASSAVEIINTATGLIVLQPY